MLIYRMNSDSQGKVEKHFKVKEFACKDGSDLVLIDEKLAELLENIREHFESLSISTQHSEQKVGTMQLEAVDTADT